MSRLGVPFAFDVMLTFFLFVDIDLSSLEPDLTQYKSGDFDCIVNANIHEPLLRKSRTLAIRISSLLAYRYPNERTAMTSVAPANPAKQMHVDIREAQT